MYRVGEQNTQFAVLLLNLGSPQAPSVQAVKPYLAEFLMDERVIDKPYWLRWLIVHGGILPFRPKATAHAYRTLWTQEGSPLVVISKQLQAALQERIQQPVFLAMRYGQPSIEAEVQKLCDAKVTDLFVLPLYPHYAMSSYETAVVAAMKALRQAAPHIRVTLQQPFYKHPGYIDALCRCAEPFLKNPYDYLLFSFHGIPERHLRKSDASQAHCLSCADCCQTAHPAHATCYRHQCFETVRAFVEKMDLPKSRYGVAFQSRLGRSPWLKPYTDLELERLPKQGVKRLLVLSPSFVSDCLETLEELSIRGKETFLAAGGSSFCQIPCLNTHPAWVDFLAASVQEAREGLRGAKEGEGQGALAPLGSPADSDLLKC